MSRLWVRNLIGMVVTAAALAIIGCIDLYPDWSSYRQRVEPRHVISRGESASALGQTWRLGSVRRVATLPSSSFGPSIPRGATLSVVTFERSGAPTAGRCIGVITDGRRRWQDQSASGVTYPVDAGATEFCSKPGPLQLNFLLPGDVRPTAVDVTDGNNAILLRVVF